MSSQGPQQGHEALRWGWGTLWAATVGIEAARQEGTRFS